MKEEGVEEKEEKRGRSGVVVDFTLRQNIVAGLVGRGWSLGKTRLPVSLIHLTSSSPVNPESDLVVQSVSNYPWIERERGSTCRRLEVISSGLWHSHINQIISSTKNHS